MAWASVESQGWESEPDVAAPVYPTAEIAEVPAQVNLEPISLSASVVATGTPVFAWSAHGPDGTTGTFSSTTSATPTWTPTARGEWTIILLVTDDVGTTIDTETVRCGWVGPRVLDAADSLATLSGSYVSPSITTSAGQTTVSVDAATAATVAAHCAVKLIDTGLIYSQLAGRTLIIKIYGISGVSGDAILICGISPSLAAITENNALVARCAISGVSTTHAGALVSDGGAISFTAGQTNTVRILGMMSCTVEGDSTGGPAGGIGFVIRTGANPTSFNQFGTRNLSTGTNKVYAFIGGGSNNTSAAAATATFEISLD